MVDPPSDGAPEQAPRWDLTGTEGYGGGTRVFSVRLMVSGYVGIYRRKEGTGAKRGAHEAGGAPPPLWTPRLPYSVVLKSPVRILLQKYFSRSFIPFGLCLIVLFCKILK